MELKMRARDSSKLWFTVGAVLLIVTFAAVLGYLAWREPELLARHFEGLAAAFAFLGLSLTLTWQIHDSHRQTAAQRFETIFFQYVAIFRAGVEGLRIGTESPSAIIRRWNEDHGTYSSAIDQYMARIAVAVRMIRRARIGGQDEYFHFFAAQLSPEEVELCRRYSLTRGGATAVNADVTAIVGAIDQLNNSASGDAESASSSRRESGH
jgi:hypothetical protein